MIRNPWGATHGLHRRSRWVRTSAGDVRLRVTVTPMRAPRLRRWVAATRCMARRRLRSPANAARLTEAMAQARRGEIAEHQLDRSALPAYRCPIPTRAPSTAGTNASTPTR